mgnify:CR=1 FL=1
MKKLSLILAVLMSCSVWATPKKVEIVFLSEPKATSLISPLWIPLIQTAQADWDKDCVPTGDGCFHPQLGYVEKEGIKKPKADETAKPLKTFNSSDVNLVDCREGEYFDIFCGKAKKEEIVSNDVEIWIDTSASLRKMDFSTDPARCLRRSFVEKIQKQCNSSGVVVQTYDTSIKTMGSLEGLCQNYGSNDVARLIKWIKASTAKYLIIVTDLDELSRELRDYLDSIDAIYHGGDLKSYTSKDLEGFVDVVKKHCK